MHSSDEEPTTEEMIGVYVKDKCFIPTGCGAELPDSYWTSLRIGMPWPCSGSSLGRPARFLTRFLPEGGHEALPPPHDASSLANDILMQLQKEADGHYQSADYFSLD